MYQSDSHFVIGRFALLTCSVKSDRAPESHSIALTHEDAIRLQFHFEKGMNFLKLIAKGRSQIPPTQTVRSR